MIVPPLIEFRGVHAVRQCVVQCFKVDSKGMLSDWVIARVREGENLPSFCHLRVMQINIAILDSSSRLPLNVANNR